VRHTLLRVLAVAALVTLASRADAMPITLTFEGLDNLEMVGDFYNGGAGGDFGITFSETARGIVDRDNGGTGNFANEPSPDTVMFFDEGDFSTTMNVLDGFSSSFSFLYTSLSYPAALMVWSGLDGQGGMLGGMFLPALPSACGGGDPDGEFSCWSNITVAFQGTARSVTFGGIGNFIGLDNISLDPHAPIPEPASLLLVGTGIGLVALRRRRNARRTA
jgi:hypothetical protein